MKSFTISIVEGTLLLIYTVLNHICLFKNASFHIPRSARNYLSILFLRMLVSAIVKKEYWTESQET